MVHLADQTQGPRNDVVSIAVTAHERQAVEAVAAAKQCAKSDVLRKWSLDDVLTMYERIQAAVSDEPAQ